MDVKVLFQFEGGNIDTLSITSKDNSKMSEVISSLAKKVQSDINLKDYIFLYNGTMINTDLTIAQIRKAPKEDMIINVKQSSKLMKCPKCDGGTCFIKIENYGVKFFGCEKQGHMPETRQFEDYEDSQKMNYNKIKCYVCAKTQNQDRREFYKCLNCTTEYGKSVYYCEVHSKTHAQDIGEEHKTVKYSEKNYYCLIHSNEFSSYCYTCKRDLCKECKKNHSEEHKVTDFATIAPKTKKIKDELEEIRKKIAKVRLNIIQLKEMIDGALNVLNNYYNISMDLIRKYETYNKTLRNYHVIKNINSLSYSNENIKNDLDEILTRGKTSNDYIQQYEKLINIYVTAKENYLGGPAVENVKNSINQKNKNANIANIKANNIEKVDQSEGGSIKINKKDHNISNSKNNNK